MSAAPSAKIRCPRCARTLAEVDTEGLALRYRDRVAARLQRVHVECLACGVMVSLFANDEGLTPKAAMP